MSDLGDLLELVHDARGRTTPATLTVIEWSHAARAAAAFERFMQRRPGGGHALFRSGASHGEAPEESSWSTTLAYERGDRFREEAAGRQAGTRFLVRDGESWLSWDATWGTVSSDVEHEGSPSSSYAFLLDPLGLLTDLRLETCGRGEHAGRTVLLARGEPREDAERIGGMLLRLGAGADVFALALDAEHGVLLRSEAHLGGEPFRRFEVRAITFGPIAAETFRVEAPPGAPPAGRWQRPLPLTLHELAAAAPFTTLVPERVPEGWRLTATFMEGRDSPPVPARAFLTYTSADGAYSVTLQERASGEEDVEVDEWREWRRVGDLEIADAGEHVEPRHHARVERHGTLVELAGGDINLLADLARALVPASSEPPRLS